MHEHFEPGDILFSSSKTVISRLLQFVQGSRFSHAAVITQQQEQGSMVLEALGEGVRMLALDDFLSDKHDVWILRPREKLDDQLTKTLGERGAIYVGKKYSSLSLWVIGLRTGILAAIAFGLFVLSRGQIWGWMQVNLLLSILLALVAWSISTNRAWCNALVDSIPWLTKETTHWLRSPSDKHYCSHLVLQVLHGCGVPNTRPDNEVTPRALYRKLYKQGYRPCIIKQRGVIISPKRPPARWRRLRGCLGF